MTEYNTPTKVQNAATKQGLRVSKSLKGRITSYATDGLVIRKAYFAETSNLDSRDGWISVSYFFRGTVRPEIAAEQNEAAKKLLLGLGYENIGNLYRKAR